MFFLTTYMVKSREQKLRLDIIYLKMFLKKRRNETNTCCVFCAYLWHYLTYVCKGNVKTIQNMLSLF